MTLNEILDEADDLSRLAEMATTQSARDRILRVAQRDQFYATHGPRLVAVARAAGTLRATTGPACHDPNGKCANALCIFARAFDALAVGGEEGE